MFNRFIKKTSKVFAVVLTATLAFSPLSYAEVPTSFTNFLEIVQSDGTVSTVNVEIDENNIAASPSETNLGPVTVNAEVTELTIKSDVDGTNRTIDATNGNNNAGFKLNIGQTATIKDVTLQNFNKADDSGAVIDNQFGNISITDSKFNNNTVTGAMGDSGFGGVINHDAKTEEETRIGSLTVVGSTFTANQATVAGAIMSTGNIEVRDTKFENNSAQAAGAIGIFGSKRDTTSFDNVEFDGNTAVLGGGAIALGSEANISLLNSKFTNNQVTGATGNGGAISTENFAGGGIDYSNASLTIEDSEFTGNKALNGKGGAIDNYFYRSKTGENVNDYVFIKGTEFSTNQATDGGAIYNHKYYEEHEVSEDVYEPNDEPTSAKMLIKNSTFSGNIASGKGGAIYNEGDLTVNNSVFSGNTANGVANDIYNDGALSFLSGESTMTGGIIGNGTTTVKGATLTLDNAASLEQWGLNVEEDSALTMNYENLTIKNTAKEIKNEGLITFNILNAGTIDLDYSFTGEAEKGKVIFNNLSGGDVTVNADDIVQSTVTVNGFDLSVGSGKTITANSLSGDGSVDNKGTIDLDLLANNGYALTGDLTGAGTTNIHTENITGEDTNVVLDLAAKVIEQTFNFVGDKSVFVQGGLAAGSAVILNNYLTGNSLEITETFDPSIVVNNYVDSSLTQGIVNVMYKGQVNTLTNNGGIVNVVNIDSEKSDNTAFAINDLTTLDSSTYGVLNNNLNIGNSTTGGMAAINSGKTISYQNVKVSSGSLDASAGTIDNSIVTIEENGQLVANASNITNLRNATDGSTTDAEISNAGELKFTAGTNSNEITGTGILSIAGTVANTVGKSIVQNAINIISGQFTASANDIDTTAGTGIANEASLVFEDTVAMTNNNEITTTTTNGTLSILSDLDNTANINQKSVTIGDGSSKNAAVTNSAVIKSTDVVINAGSSLVTTNEIDTYDHGNITGGKITNEGEFTIKDVEDVVNNNTITGTDGTFKLENTGLTNENGSITQKYVEVDEDSSLASALSKLNVSGDIKNAGTVTLSGGTSDSYATNGNVITGLTSIYGYTIFDTNSYITNNANVTQSSVTFRGTVANTDGKKFTTVQRTGDETARATIVIEEGGKLTINASDLVINGITSESEKDFVSNEGELIFTGGTNSNIIKGDGTVKITGDVINDVDLVQSTITVNSGMTFTNNSGRNITTNYLSGEGTLTNNGKINLDLLDEKGYDIATLNGVGVSSITATTSGINLDLTGKNISQNEIYFYGDNKTLTLTNGAINAVTKIINYVTGDSLHLVDTVLTTPLFVNEEDGHTVFENGSGVTGVIQNNSGTIDVLSNSFVTGNNITSTNTTDITKNILNIGDATHAASLTSDDTISYQKITVSSGTMTMKNGSTDGIIDHSSIEVTSNGKLVANASNITNLSGTSIANAGITEFYAGTNSNAITGTGTLNITGTVTNSNGTSITQNKIEITDAGTFTANANDIDTTAGSGINNDGTLKFVGTDTVNTSTITASATNKGTLEIGDGAAAGLKNTATITQKDITVKANAALENVEDTTITATNKVAVEATGSVNNAGTIDVSAGTFDNKGDVTNDGTITAGTFENSATTATITNQNNGNINVTGILTNRGIINNNDDAILHAGGGIINYGTITAVTASSVTATVYNGVDGTSNGTYTVHGGTIAYNVSGVSADKSTVNVFGNVGVDAEAVIAQNTVNLGNGTNEAGLKLYDESSIRASKLVINDNTTLNTINGKVGTINSDGSITIADGANWKYELDVNLKEGTGDSLINVSAGTGSTASISELGIMSDKAELTSIKIADANIINAASVVQNPVYTSELTYKVTARGETDATYLDIIADGYGGLANAVYDGVGNYSVTLDNDDVTSWIFDPKAPEEDKVQHNFLKNSLTITGNYKNLETTTGVDGIVVSSGTSKNGTTLKIKNLQSMSGFKNAITVDEYGALKIIDQEDGVLTFSNNTGSAVITSSGTAWIDNAVFSNNNLGTDGAVIKNGGEDMRLSRLNFTGNTAALDIFNDHDGKIYIGDATGAGTASIFEKGIGGDGDLTIDGVILDMTNAVISQDEIAITDNDDSGLITKVENLTYNSFTTHRIDNDSANLKLIGKTDGTSAALNTQINGSGTTTFVSSTTVNMNIKQGAVVLGDGSTKTQVIVNNKISADNITIDANSELNANADNINTATDGKIANSGLVEFTGGTNKNVIDGTGSLKISGDVKNSTGTAVSQKDITVNSGKSFEANATDLTTTNGIVNAGDLTFTGGTNIAANEITGAGNLTILDNLINNANITQSIVTVKGGITENNASITTTGAGITIDNGATLLTHGGIDTYTAGGQITNNGILDVSVAGNAENQNAISGEGIFKVSAGEFDNIDGNIQQNKVIVSETAVFKSSATLVQTTAGIVNDGAMTFFDGTNDNAINGTGDLTIDGAVVNTTGKAVNQNLITVNSGKSLEANADDITTTDKIANEGVLTFVGGNNKNAITGTNGEVVINGDVVNSTGTAVNQKKISVVSGKSLEISANDITTTDAIDNFGTLTFYGGTNENVITGSASGVLNIVGDLVNNKNISQKTINVKNGMTVNNADIIVGSDGVNILAGAGLTTDASKINSVSPTTIANAGDLIFTGGTNGNAITGDGALTVDGDVINNNTISQNNMIVTSVGIFKTDIGNVTTTSGIASNGLMEFTGGTNNNVITGTGTIKMTGAVINNDKDITQRTIDITSAGSMQTNADNIILADGITNAGVITFTGGTNDDAITGTGDLVIDGAVINALGTVISQDEITVNSGKNWTAFASDITTTTGILNDGTMTYTGGVNVSTITRTASNGTLNVTGDMFNTAKITQETINVASEYFYNVRGSSITAETITADTRFVTDAKDLDATTITNNIFLNLTDDTAADLAANIGGNGELIKTGDGIVTLAGTNTYASSTTISAGALRISKKENISDQKDKIVYMNGGKLITTNDMTLDSTFVGTDADNKVNMEVEAGTTILSTDSKIYGNNGLVKTGVGTLDLQMAENYYAGDTEIQNGKVRGTTANILGKVIGTGDATSTAEFYDATGDVVLNEIDTTKYLGKFEKTGDASMTVDKNFKAIDADITAGTFIINNDASMGGSGSTFEVTNNMNVTNALLKGYGDITVGTLTIGDGATYAPGNSTTTFKVAGNLHYENNSTYDVEIGQSSYDAPGTYNDKTTVTNDTTIDAGSKLVLNNVGGKYYLHETINLIESGGTLTNNGYVSTGSDTYTDEGDYHKVVDGTITFKDFDASDLRDGYDTRISTRVYVDGSTLKIELERKASEYESATEFARSHNEQQAAEAIDRLSALSNEGDITNILDKMEEYYYYKTTYDVDALKLALNDIAGVIHANTTNLTFFNAKAEHVYDKIQERTLDLYPCTKFHDKIWGQYYYNYNSVNENSNSPKYTSSVNGFLVGFDMVSADNWTIGAMAGYGTSELKQHDDKSTMDDINLGFYGGYFTDNWEFKGMLLGGYEQYKTDRTIHFLDERRIANSEHTGYSGALDLEAAYNIALNEVSKSDHKLFLKPFVGLMNSYMSNSGYKEKGAQSLNLKIEDYNSFASEARAGVGINGKAKKFGWYAKAGLRQLLTNNYNEIKSSLLDYSETTKMKIRSANNAKTTFTGGIGADYKLSEDWTVFTNALANLSGVSDNYYANVGLSYKFGCKNNKERKETVSKVAAEAKGTKEGVKEDKSKYRVIKSVVLEEKPTFVFGTDELNNSGKEKLEQVASDLEDYPDAIVVVEGHADSTGSDFVNQKISEKRAAKIAKSLKEDYNVKNTIVTAGRSKTYPIASNDTKEGRAQNRRVEIVILDSNK